MTAAGAGVTVDDCPPQPPRTPHYLAAVALSYAKPASFPAFHLCRQHPPTSFILHNVSFTAAPGELTAIVGPSGAGKSSLLDLLAARTVPSGGALLLDNLPLRRARYRKLSAHVPQHDHHLDLLTVHETFLFYASMMYGDPSEAAAAASSLLMELRLTHAAQTRASSKRLSGGELRRVSIGLALLRRPGVLLLDEPTTGLDSAAANVVVGCLRDAAMKRGTTVVLSIHQPSSRLLAAVDSLLLLAGGKVLHHGSLAALDARLLSLGLAVPAQLNPLEFAMEVLDKIPAEETLQKEDDTEKIGSHGAGGGKDDREEDQPVNVSRRREILLLYKRSWRIVYRSKQLLLTNFVESLLVGTLLGSIYVNAGDGDTGARKRLGLFAFTLTFLLSSTTETLPIFVAERPIVLRDCAAGLYRLSSHVVASTLVFLPYLLAVALLYSCSVYFLVGLCTSSAASFAVFALVVWSVNLTANSFVLFVSSFAPDYISGMSLLSTSLAGFFLFSGYFLARDSMPPYWAFMHYVSPYKYALDALLANEYGCAAARCFSTGDNGQCLATGADVLASRGLRSSDKWTALQVLLGFFVLYRVLYWVVLGRRAARSRR